MSKLRLNMFNILFLLSGKTMQQVDRPCQASCLLTVNTEYTVNWYLKMNLYLSPTFSLEIFPCSRRCWALGKSGSNVPVLELKEYFLVKPPWEIKQCQALLSLVDLDKIDFIFYSRSLYCLGKSLSLTSFFSLLPENLWSKRNRFDLRFLNVSKYKYIDIEIFKRKEKKKEEDEEEEERIILNVLLPGQTFSRIHRVIVSAALFDANSIVMISV